MMPTVDDADVFSTPDQRSSATTPFPALTLDSETAAQVVPKSFEARDVTRLYYDEIQILRRVLATTSLPKDCVVYFSSLAHRILQIGGLLFPSNGRAFHPTDTQEILEHSQILSAACRFSTAQAAGQIANVNFITKLAPFTIYPGPEDLWVNYRQIVSLITT